jgi:hypothetical protein
MKVLLAPVGGMDVASSRYRVHELVPHLQDLGLSCVVKTRPSRSGYVGKLSVLSYFYDLVRECSGVDIVYLQKQPFPPVMNEILCRAAKNLIFDFDDAIYAAAPWSSSPGTAHEKNDRLNSILKSASGVVTGSPNLTEYASQYASDTWTLPTALPKESYSGNVNRPARTSNGTSIGWIGNPENLWYLDQIESQLITVLDSYENVSLHIITSIEGDNKFLGHREDVKYHSWSRSEELSLLHDTDFCIRPLTDDLWSSGKGGYTSVIQSMAMRKPVIASDVGMLPGIIEHGSSGLIARDRGDWEHLLRLMISENHSRQNMAEGAFARVDELGYWSHLRARQLVSVFRSVLANK